MPQRWQTRSVWIGLAGRLISWQMQRREKSFEIMREHLVIRSDQAGNA
jgi:hypothetical protein